jgi:hypothetical protein
MTWAIEVKRATVFQSVTRSQNRPRIDRRPQSRTNRCFRILPPFMRGNSYDTCTKPVLTATRVVRRWPDWTLDAFDYQRQEYAHSNPHGADRSVLAAHVHNLTSG